MFDTPDILQVAEKHSLGEFRWGTSSPWIFEEGVVLETLWLFWSTYRAYRWQDVDKLFFDTKLDLIRDEGFRRISTQRVMTIHLIFSDGRDMKLNFGGPVHHSADYLFYRDGIPVWEPSPELVEFWDFICKEKVGRVHFKRALEDLTSGEDVPFGRFTATPKGIKEGATHELSRDHRRLFGLTHAARGNPFSLA